MEEKALIRAHAWMCWYSSRGAPYLNGGFATAWMLRGGPFRRRGLVGLCHVTETDFQAALVLPRRVDEKLRSAQVETPSFVLGIRPPGVFVPVTSFAYFIDELSKSWSVKFSFGPTPEVRPKTSHGERLVTSLGRTLPKKGFVTTRPKSGRGGRE